MSTLFAVTTPFFALVLCGFLGARSKLLPEAAIPGLNAYVLFFALPCLLFRFGDSTPFARLVDPSLIAVYLAGATALVGIAVATTRRPGRLARVDLAFGALVAAFPNTGFMGVPLVVALLGHDAAGPMIITLLVDLIFTSTLCLAIAQSGGAGPGVAGPVLAPRPSVSRSSLLRSLRGALINPLPWSIALGAAWSAVGGRLPAPAERVVALLADSATPVALFTIGAVLWRAGQHARLDARRRTPVGAWLPVTLLKLVVHPLAVFAIGRVLQRLGVPVPGFGLDVLVLAAALPSASNVSMLAERFGADNGRVARIVMASTAGAFFSFPFAAWVVRGWAG